MGGIILKFARKGDAPVLNTETLFAEDPLMLVADRLMLLPLQVVIVKFTTPSLCTRSSDHLGVGVAVVL